MMGSKTRSNYALGGSLTEGQWLEVFPKRIRKESGINWDRTVRTTINGKLKIDCKCGNIFTAGFFDVMARCDKCDRSIMVR
jgi:hypothetical protein